jgi:hypothetical protein
MREQYHPYLPNKAVMQEKLCFATFAPSTKKITLPAGSGDRYYFLDAAGLTALQSDLASLSFF